MKIPIDRNTTDKFYRYQMEEIKIKIEGRGNGIKTVLINLNEISLSLKRDSLEILKYLGYELGTLGKKEKGLEKYIINGQHTLESIKYIIYEYIDNYVMCKKCNNPETFYIKDKILLRECYACGFRSKTEGRLSNFIGKDLDSSTKNESYNCSLSSFVVTDLSIASEAIVIESNTVVSSYECDMSFFGYLYDCKGSLEKCCFILPDLENYLVKMEKETDVCNYLDFVIKEGLLKKSEIYLYFRSKSKAVDKLSSKRIRSFLEEYFD